MPKNDPTGATSRSRPRKKAEHPAPPVADNPPVVPVKAKNVGALESVFSLVLGILFVVGALFPRSIKQCLLLGLGGGLVYRGMTSHCGLYQALGLDSEKGSLSAQINAKYLAGPADKNG